MKKTHASPFAIALLAMALAAPSFAQQPSAGFVTRYADPQGLISEWVVEQPSTYRAGARLFFLVSGASGAKATVTAQTTRGSKTIALAETDPGRYEGFYTLRGSDDFTRPSFTARLEKRGEVSEAWAGSANDRSWEERPGPWRRGHHEELDIRDNGELRHDRDSWTRQPRFVCPACGSVTSVRSVDEESSDASAPGIVIGGLLGGLLGNQVGGGHGRDASTVLGALGGGFLGNEIGKAQGHRQAWITTVSLDNGDSQSFRTSERPGVHVNQRVRVENNQLYPETR